jgi:hypothetical protein
VKNVFDLQTHAFTMVVSPESVLGTHVSGWFRGQSGSGFSSQNGPPKSMLLRFSLRLARALFRDHYFYYFYFSKPDLSDFLDVKHLEYATGLLKNYTIVMAGASAFE